MSREQEPNYRPILNRLELVEYFRAGEKVRAQRAIGTETEKFVVRASEGRMLTFEESGGFGSLFRELVARYDWEPTAPDEGNVVALVGPLGAVTLEPGGQLELSGAICKTIFETEKEFDTHMAELKAVADEDLRFVIWGMNPCVDLDDVPWMPKSRYRIMRNYLPTKGDLAHWMMKTTCTIQANFDFCSEEDAVSLVHTGVLVSPVAGALFANSPIRNKQKSGFQSFRNHIWTRTDPDRTGVPSFMYRDDWGYADYIDYVFDVPMFFIRRDNRYIDMTGLSFAEFVEKGYQGHNATVGDFELHLSTLFPDVRMKKFVEVRSADGGPREAVLALPAFWKGIIYDDEARKEARDLFSSGTEEAHRELTRICTRDGLHGDSAYGSVLELARELIQISERGLERIAATAGHDSEAIFLAPLKERVNSGRSWADELLQSFDELGCDLTALAERWQL